MENINSCEHNGTESHVSNIFLFAMETRRHFAIYQQVCCQMRVEGLLPAHCACPGTVQLSLMRGRNSFVFPTAHLELRRLAESLGNALCCHLPAGSLEGFLFSLWEWGACLHSREELVIRYFMVCQGHWPWHTKSFAQACHPCMFTCFLLLKWFPDLFFILPPVGFKFLYFGIPSKHCYVLMRKVTDKDW